MKKQIEDLLGGIAEMDKDRCTDYQLCELARLDFEHIKNKGMDLQSLMDKGMGSVSDGYHTFDELYEHRCVLFLSLVSQAPALSWFSATHNDGTAFDGWFIIGMTLPDLGDITYHLPMNMWEAAIHTGAEELEKGKKWDGHTSEEVLERMKEYFLGGFVNKLKKDRAATGEDQDTDPC